MAKEEKKTASKSTTKSTVKKTTAKTKAPAKKVEIKKTNKTTKAPAKKNGEVKIVDTYEAKLKESKKESKLKKWFNNLALEQIVIGGVVVIAILLIVLIFVSTKNTKTKNGDDIVISVDGKTITANELYKELKSQNGRTVAINLIDDYITNKEYKTTDDMKKSAESTIESYKSQYGDSYESFLEYNGIGSDNELKDLLIKNAKLTKITEKYIKDNLTEKEMKDYYENSIVGDISAKHILISAGEDATDEEKTAAKAKAEEVIKKLKSGEKFDDLAKEYSDEDSTKNNGGDLGYFNTGDMVEPFEKAAYALDVDEYTTSPVETTYGYHVIMKTGKKEKPTYEKSKDTIIEKLVEEKKANDSTISVKAMIALRKKYNIKITDKAIKKDYKSYTKDAITTTTTTTTTATSTSSN